MRSIAREFDQARFVFEFRSHYTCYFVDPWLQDQPIRRCERVPCPDPRDWNQISKTNGVGNTDKSWDSRGAIIVCCLFCISKYHQTCSPSFLWCHHHCPPTATRRRTVALRSPRMLSLTLRKRRHVQMWRSRLQKLKLVRWGLVAWYGWWLKSCTTFD